MWKLGRIDTLISGNAGNVHTADIYLSGIRHMQRPINMLYPLELHDGQVDKSVSDNVIFQDAGHSEDKSMSALRPSIRQAAINARHKINDFWRTMLQLFYILNHLYFIARVSCIIS